MSRTQTLALTATGLAVIVGAVWWSVKNPPRAAVDKNPALTAAKAERLEGDQRYASDPKRAEESYRDFIAKHESAKDPKVQDEVGNARIRLGYLAARTKDFSKARTAFLEAEQKYKGTGQKGSDFGGIPDQAAYQAAVCLMADGKKDEAYAAFREFLTKHKLSPLTHAAHRRLNMLEPEKQDEHDALLQAAVTAQEKHIRFETSVCGPKAIVYLLESLGKPKRDYKELAKLCGTTDDGTTIEGMRKGLKAVGLESFGYELNRADFLKLEGPAILLHQDHYVVYISQSVTDVTVYDPIKGGEEKLPLPKADQTDFTIPVLTLEPLELR